MKTVVNTCTTRTRREQTAHHAPASNVPRTVRAALAAWKWADQDQHKAEEDQGKLLGQLDTKVAEVNTKRREIQLAADTAWPHTGNASAPIRRAFKLPVNQPIAK